MNWKSVVAVVCCVGAIQHALPLAAADVGAGSDFMVGTWTRDGDCLEGDTVVRDGDKFRSKIRGQNYVGTVQREGDIIKANFSAEDGNARRYTYHIENDNRLRVIDLTVCDRVHCELMHVQSFFYVMRCAE
jgi:hypothetical protein